MLVAESTETLEDRISSFSAASRESGSAYGVGDSGIADRSEEAVFPAVRRGSEEVDVEDTDVNDVSDGQFGICGMLSNPSPITDSVGDRADDARLGLRMGGGMYSVADRLCVFEAGVEAGVDDFDPRVGVICSSSCRPSMVSAPGERVAARWGSVSPGTPPFMRR